MGTTRHGISHDSTFRDAGGFDFTDALADGMYERATSNWGSGPGVVVNRGELLWLIEGYTRLREQGDEG